jgi:hypothetical protein
MIDRSIRDDSPLQNFTLAYDNEGPEVQQRDDRQIMSGFASVSEAVMTGPKKGDFSFRAGAGHI